MRKFLIVPFLFLFFGFTYDLIDQCGNKFGEVTYKSPKTEKQIAEITKGQMSTECFNIVHANDVPLKTSEEQIQDLKEQVAELMDMVSKLPKKEIV